MRLRATRLSAISNALRSVFKIASVNPVLWWDAESHRAALAGGAATLFQDAAGLNAGGVEQPVGLVRDVSKSTLGPERNSDLGFSSWSVLSGAWTLSSTSAVGVNATGFIYSPGAQDVAGAYWEVSGTISGYSSGYIYVSVTTGTEDSSRISGNGAFKVRCQDFHPAQNWAVYIKGENFTGTITNLSIRQVIGLNAVQSTSTARPLLTARKNLLTYSEQFDNAIWAKSVFTVAAKSATAPDGTQTADTITTGASSGYILQANAAANGSARSITGSLYIKNATGIGSQTVVINLSDGVVGGLRVVFNLAAGTFTLPGLPASWSNVTRTVTPVGDGWFRVVLSGTTAQWTGGWFEVIADNIGGAAFRLWGAQLEYGLSATGYQRITTASDYNITAAPLMLRFDGADDGIASATFTAGTLPASADAYLVIWPDADEQEIVLVEDPSSLGSRYFAVRHPTQTSIRQRDDGPTTANASYTVNGSQVGGTANPTRAQLSTATQTGVPVLLQITNLNLSAWAQVGLGRYVGSSSGFGYRGRYGCMLITTAQSDSTRAKIRRALAKAYQIQGVV